MALSRRGRKIATWDFTINQVPVEVDVKLRRQRNGASDDEKGEFFVKLENGDTVVDTDIDKLRQEVERKLKERMELQWGLFVEITAQRRRGSSSSARGSGVEMSYRYVAIAERDDQEDLYRYVDKRKVERGEWEEVHENLHKGSPRVGVRSEFGSRTMTSLLPCTSERVAALESILDRFEALWDMIEERFSPDEAHHTLEQVAQDATMFLPPTGNEQ